MSCQLPIFEKIWRQYFRQPSSHGSHEEASSTFLVLRQSTGARNGRENDHDPTNGQPFPPRWSVVEVRFPALVAHGDGTFTRFLALERCRGGKEFLQVRRFFGESEFPGSHFRAVYRWWIQRLWKTSTTKTVEIVWKKAQHANKFSSWSATLILKHRPQLRNGLLFRERKVIDLEMLIHQDPQVNQHMPSPWAQQPPYLKQTQKATKQEDIISALQEVLCIKQNV